MSAVESTATQCLRVTLTRQLAEVLLRGISGAGYKPPEDPIDTMGTRNARRYLSRTNEQSDFIAISVSQSP